MTTLKEQYHTGMTLEETEKMILQTLKNVMEDAISKENVELCVIRSDTKRIENKTADQLDAIIQ